MQDLEKFFTKQEISTINRFVTFVADSNNQTTESNFSATETDAEIKNDVLDWLDRRYRRGERANGYTPKKS